jgi:streptomycin 6-kinase
MNFPPAFTANVLGAFGERGRAFLADLPDLVESARRKWELGEIEAVSNLSYHFVAFTTRGDQPVVLKIGVPDRELFSEIAALRAFMGDGAVGLLDSEAEAGRLLLERLSPGRMLSELADDDEATRTAAQVMLKLRRVPPPHNDFVRLEDWVDGFQARHHGRAGAGPMDEALLDRAVRIFRSALDSDAAPALLHGDLHHFNMLSSSRGWLAIDPKGVIGPPEYEIGSFMINPWMVAGLPIGVERMIERRVAIFSEQLGFQPQRILELALAHAVLSASWSLDDRANWEPAMACAGVFADLLHIRR